MADRDELGLTITGSQDISLIGKTAYQFEITGGGSVADKIRQLAAFQIIGGATPQYSYRMMQDAAAARSDSMLEGDAGQYVLQKLQLTDVHRVIRGSNISIAVIDSEIDGTHPDLVGVISGRYDATMGGEEQPHSHGTGMAGAIASHRRLVGTAPGARLLAIRAFSSKAANAESTTFNILKGLEYAVNNGVRIVNMSFAGPRDPSIERALPAAAGQGVILIPAAGNAGPKPPLFPAADQT